MKEANQSYEKTFETIKKFRKELEKNVYDFFHSEYIQKHLTKECNIKLDGLQKISICNGDVYRVAELNTQIIMNSIDFARSFFDISFSLYGYKGKSRKVCKIPSADFQMEYNGKIILYCYANNSFRVEHS